MDRIWVRPNSSQELSGCTVMWDTACGALTWGWGGNQPHRNSKQQSMASTSKFLPGDKLKLYSLSVSGILVKDKVITFYSISREFIHT